MVSEGAVWHPCHRVGTTVHVARDGEYLGHIVISDEIKSDAAAGIKALKAAGVRKTVMLTGDSDEVAAPLRTRSASTRSTPSCSPPTRWREWKNC